MKTLETIDITMTIEEIAARYPQTVPVFQELGFDTCCGGNVTVLHAALRDDLDFDEVLESLSRVVHIG